MRLLRNSAVLSIRSTEFCGDNVFNSTLILKNCAVVASGQLELLCSTHLPNDFFNYFSGLHRIRYLPVLDPSLSLSLSLSVLSLVCLFHSLSRMSLPAPLPMDILIVSDEAVNFATFVDRTFLYRGWIELFWLFLLRLVQFTFVLFVVL